MPRVEADAAPMAPKPPLLAIPMDGDMRKSGERRLLQTALAEVFTPSAPIVRSDLLQGRQDLLAKIRTVLGRKSGHLIVYGERGVGKTSLVKVAAQELESEGMRVVYYPINEGATFETVFAAIQNELGVGWVPTKAERGLMVAGEAGISAVGLAQASGEVEKHKAVTSEALSKGGLLPFEVAHRLKDQSAVIILDDFECVSTDEMRARFSTLAKNLSDEGGNQCHLVLVGVAEAVTGLVIRDERALRVLNAIHVQRLTDAEIRGIAETGFRKLGLAAESGVFDQIVHYSANYPYYTHMLCEGLVRTYIDAAQADPPRPTRTIHLADMPKAIEYALESTNSNIVYSYDTAAGGTERARLVLYAIAGVRKDRILRRQIVTGVNAVQTESESAIDGDLRRMVEQGVLKRLEQGVYTFSDPLMRAYAILRFRRDTPPDRVAQIDRALASLDKEQPLAIVKGA